MDLVSVCQRPLKSVFPYVLCIPAAMLFEFSYIVYTALTSGSMCTVVV